MNSHASFRAAVHLTLTGQLPSVFMALRGALESAMYANLIVVDPKSQDIWLDRHKSLETRNRCKNEFTAKACFRALADAQHKDFSNGVRDQYEAAIDFGAHPNSKSIMNSVRLSQLEGGDHALELAYVHGWRSTELKQCVVACAEIGTSIAFIGLICLPNHPHLKALNDRVLAFQDALPELIRLLGLRLAVAEEPASDRVASS